MDFIHNTNVKSERVYGKELNKEVFLSIVVPTYKRVDLLRKCLRSIIKQNPVSEIIYEILVVSNDPEFDYNNLNLKLDPEIFSIYVNKENLGMCGNMNRCALLASGQYVAYIQDDDFLMPNFIETIEQLKKNNLLNRVDCLIPNRYYWMKNSSEKFGEKALRHMRMKDIASQIIRIGKSPEFLQQLFPAHTINTMYTSYSGGPTCGITFDRKSLIESGGFNQEYPYGFDYVFFTEFSEHFRTYLLNEFVSVYRTENSATNRPEVQLDFFHAKYDYLIMHRDSNEFISNNINTLTACYYDVFPDKVKYLINERYSIPNIPNWKKSCFRLLADIRLYRSGVYRRKPCPENVIQWYKSL